MKSNLNRREAANEENKLKRKLKNSESLRRPGNARNVVKKAIEKAFI